MKISLAWSMVTLLIASAAPAAYSDGTYKKTLTLTGVSSGSFSIGATVAPAVHQNVYADMVPANDCSVPSQPASTPPPTQPASNPPPTQTANSNPPQNAAIDPAQIGTLPFGGDLMDPVIDLWTIGNPEQRARLKAISAAVDAEAAAEEALARARAAAQSAAQNAANKLSDTLQGPVDVFNNLLNTPAAPPDLGAGHGGWCGRTIYPDGTKRVVYNDGTVVDTAPPPGNQQSIVDKLW